MAWKRRESKREWMRSVALVCFSMAVLLMSWEGQKTEAAVAQTTIPKDSIRLRILANSDLPEDQLVKRHVRDAVVEQMNSWVKTLNHPESLDEARTIIRAKLPEIEKQVGQTLKVNGKFYGYHVELGVVPFPTKMYGGEVYPAGDYEAVRVTLGAGAGQNWWCVLFPPLCFIDAGTGDAVPKNGAEVKTASARSVNTQKDAQAPEVRFFLWDVISSIIHWISNLFA